MILGFKLVLILMYHPLSPGVVPKATLKLKYSILNPQNKKTMTSTSKSSNCITDRQTDKISIE